MRATKFFSWLITVGIAVAFVAIAPDAAAQATTQAAMRVKSWNSVVVAQLRDARGEAVPFDFVSQVAILSNGSVLVGDRYDQRIVLTDSAGRFVASAGRKGAGPGEFETRSRLLRLRGDSIGVYDGTLRRMSVFDSKLRFARTELIEEFSPASGFSAFEGQFANGSMVMLHRPMLNFRLADGVHDVQTTLYVRDGRGNFRQFRLPSSRELHVTAGNRGATAKVPITIARAVAVCETGFVTIADNRIEAYDTAFKLLFTSPYRGRVDTLSSAERTQLIQIHSGGYDNRPSNESSGMH